MNIRQLATNCGIDVGNIEKHADTEIVRRLEAFAVAVIEEYIKFNAGTENEISNH